MHAASTECQRKEWPRVLDLQNPNLKTNFKITSCDINYLHLKHVLVGFIYILLIFKALLSTLRVGFSKLFVAGKHTLTNGVLFKASTQHLVWLIYTTTKSAYPLEIKSK